MIRIMFTFLFLTTVVLAQAPANKLTSNLKLKLSETSENQEILVWVYLNDKGINKDYYFNNPLSVVSEKSLHRRSKVLPENKLITFEDLPVNQAYISGIQNSGLKIRHKSRWLNAVSGYINKDLIGNLSMLPFVKKIDMVFSLSKQEPVESISEPLLMPEQTLNKQLLFDYGPSLAQLQQIKVPDVHNLGFTGQGVTICVMDAGFSRLTHQSFNNMDIIAAWDFVNGDPNVGNEGDMGEGSHGTQTLSTIGGFYEGQLIGPAFNASYILAKTENTDSETPIEEDHWIAAMEWADSIGVDVTSTSLGYLDFDPPYTSYTWQDMDGNTAVITIGADLAVARGIVVVNSAGNSGNSTHNTLGAPADGDSVIAVGSVTSTGSRSSFSSVGPTVDGRIKPDVMARGSNVVVASPNSNTSYTTASGTSFSCPLAAGVAALILCANPNLTPMQVREAMRLTALNHTSPNNLIGWGILDALQAVNYFPLPVELVSFTGTVEKNNIHLEWTTATEINNHGFEIERKSGQENFYIIGFVNGNGNTTTVSNYTFTDENLKPGNYSYRLKQVDFDGSFEYSSEINVSVLIPEVFVLFQNYPNPFNPSTTIKYSVPEQSYIKINLYDVIGNKVKTIDEGLKAAGLHQLELSAGNLTSGVYFVTLSSDAGNQAIKIILTK